MHRLALFVMVWAACGNSAPAAPPVVANTAPVRDAPPPPDARPLSEEDRMTQTFEGFADRMCICHDAACAQKVSDDMTTWSMDLARNYERKPSAEMLKRFEEITKRLVECMTKAEGSGPVAPPDAGP